LGPLAGQPAFTTTRIFMVRRSETDHPAHRFKVEYKLRHFTNGRRYMPEDFSWTLSYGIICRRNNTKRVLFAFSPFL